MANRSSSVEIAARVAEIRERIAEACVACGRDPGEVSVMAVTKTVEPERVNQAIAAGVDLLGENKAQELLAKYDSYDRQHAKIHFIGHLQTNKVAQVLNKVCMVQSLDRMSLARELQKQCERDNRTIDCLIEINLGQEETKSGVPPEELESFSEQIAALDRIQVCGLMCIPPFGVDETQRERNFARMHKLFVDISGKKIDNIHMGVLSMGMSDDYLMAVRHGTTLVRIGTLLFGSRDYMR